MSQLQINTLLKHVPDMLQERVKHYWYDWCMACDLISQDPLDNTELDVSLIGKVWACSEFVAKTMIRHPGLWFELNQSKALELNFSLEYYVQQLNQQLLQNLPVVDPDLMKLLRLFRAQQMLRIAWRDLANLADTTQTLVNLTDLAEACVDATLEHLYQDQCEQWGVPLNNRGEQQRLSVIGMGKLGGHELNFSSDIDLIFCFEEEGDMATARCRTNSQFFTRLAQRFIKMLNDITQDGFVFRVDMRLRPYGQSGPLVMSHAGFEQYYQTQGRDWERYAMIKARVIGGDRAQGQWVMNMLKPFVYRRYLDFGAFESIRDMKALIDTEIQRKGNLNNIKLGSGGIREIEFIGQTFQLLRGGSDVDLQVRGILKVLDLLAEKKYLEGDVASFLADSYDFLRRLENRLQMYSDAQTHLLPEDAVQQQSMTLAMGYKNWSELFKACEVHRQFVHATFNQLLHDTTANKISLHPLEPGRIDGDKLSKIWLYPQDKNEAIIIFQQMGIADAEKVYDLINAFKYSSQLKTMTATGRQRLDKLMPTLLLLLKLQKEPANVLLRLLGLLQAILRRSIYLSLLNEYPKALKQLIELCAASPWVAQLLSRYPVLLDELLDSRNLYQVVNQASLTRELEVSILRVKDDEERQLEVLRQFKQAQVLKIAAMDVAGVLDVFEVSGQLSVLAEVILEKVMLLAQAWMQSKYGNPAALIEGKRYQPTMAVVAYGKMGGRELSYGSDLDLVFLHDSQGTQQQTNGSKCLDNASYFARMAQRVIHLLSLRTANGRLYEIDMRLRPDGNAGMLVSSLVAYVRYQQEKAWTWEHQALIRARILCSSAHLKAEFDRIRRSILMQQRDRRTLAADVVAMREKMRDALGNKAKPNKRAFQIKQGHGGLVDIEFIAQFGVLAYASDHAKLADLTATRKILTQLVDCKLLTIEQAEYLVDAYRQYRVCSHQRALQQLPATVDSRVFDTLREKVGKIWQHVFSSDRY